MSAFIPDAVLDLMAEKFRMLADATRLSILRALMAGEKSVGTICAETAQSQANVSKHLKLLAQAGMVARRKEGLQVFYRIDDPLIEQLCKLVCGTIARDFENAARQRKRVLPAVRGAAK